jgi:hypothetical protein
MQGYSERNFSWSFCDFITYAYRDHANDPVSSYFDAGSAITKSENDANYSSASLAFPINRLKDDMCARYCPVLCCVALSMHEAPTLSLLRHLDTLLMTVLSSACPRVAVATVMCAEHGAGRPLIKELRVLSQMKRLRLSSYLFTCTLPRPAPPRPVHRPPTDPRN